jgi:hypothetical protein
MRRLSLFSMRKGTMIGQCLIISRRTKGRYPERLEKICRNAYDIDITQCL